MSFYKYQAVSLPNFIKIVFNCKNHYAESSICIYNIKCGKLFPFRTSVPKTSMNLTYDYMQTQTKSVK